MFRKILSTTIIVCFFLSTLSPYSRAYASTVSGLPAPGTMVNLSPAYEPVMIKGLTVHKDNPFLFDFIVDVGQDKMSGAPLKQEGAKLIKYFLASLAIPDKDLWVNLSPYEKSKIVPEALGQTDMGRDLLAQDYILKQITASLIYPEEQLGKTFWDKVYSKAQQMYGTTEVPVNTFNKVWIMADKAEVFEHNQTAFVVASHLKVMLEEDYLAMSKHQAPTQNTHALSSQIIKQIILPELEKEVNHGRNFANLRQIFNSIILSSWYKKNLKQALLNQVYADKARVKGIDLNDPTVKQQIYAQYLKAYKKGVFNYIKEEASHSRKYFSGGILAEGAAAHPTVITDQAMGSAALAQDHWNGIVDVQTRFNIIDPSAVSAGQGPVVWSYEQFKAWEEAQRPNDTQAFAVSQKPDHAMAGTADYFSLFVSRARWQGVIAQAKAYLDSFVYQPSTGGEPIIYTPQAETWSALSIILGKIFLEPAAQKDRILERVVYNPAVVAKLALVYEQSRMFQGGQTPEAQEKVVVDLVKRYCTDDDVLRFVSSTKELSGVFNILDQDPEKFARAFLIYEHFKGHLDDPQILTDIKAIADGTIRQDYLARVSSQMRLASPGWFKLGQSTFFQSLKDKESLSILPFFMDAFRNGENNVEFPADFLPFKPEVRLPAEYTDLEKARIKAVVRLLGIHMTIHSPIVGPMTKGFKQTLEEASDNLSLMKETIKFSADVGASVLVVHLAQKGDLSARAGYSQIILKAVGKKDWEGKPLQIGLENYMTKANAEGQRPFPTAEEHFAEFREVLLEAIKQDPRALLHAGLVLDIAHFNLVRGLNDPLEVAYKVKQFAEDLANEPAVKEALEKAGLEGKTFIQKLVCELHLNQNLGPILFLSSKDYGPDIHASVEEEGAIDIEHFVKIIFQHGFRPIVLAEQVQPLSVKGHLDLQNWTGFEPGTSVQSVIHEGHDVIDGISKEFPDLFSQMKSILVDPHEGYLPYYAYIAGLEGTDVERRDRLIRHVTRRILLRIWNAEPIDTAYFDQYVQMLGGVQIVTLHPGEILLKEGETMDQEALRLGRPAGVYFPIDHPLVVNGTAPEVGVPFQVEVPRGFPVGEVAIKANNPKAARNAQVSAGSNVTQVLYIAPDVFLVLYNTIPAFQARMNELQGKRNQALEQARVKWENMSFDERVNWFLGPESGTSLTVEQKSALKAKIDFYHQEHPSLNASTREWLNDGQMALLLACVYRKSTITMTGGDTYGHVVLSQVYQALKTRRFGNIGTLNITDEAMTADVNEDKLVKNMHRTQDRIKAQPGQLSAKFDKIDEGQSLGDIFLYHASDIFWVKFSVYMLNASKYSRIEEDLFYKSLNQEALGAISQPDAVTRLYKEAFKAVIQSDDKKIRAAIQFAIRKNGADGVDSAMLTQIRDALRAEGGSLYDRAMVAAEAAWLPERIMRAAALYDSIQQYRDFGIIKPLIKVLNGDFQGKDIRGIGGKAKQVFDAEDQRIRAVIKGLVREGDKFLMKRILDKIIEDISNGVPRRYSRAGEAKYTEYVGLLSEAVDIYNGKGGYVLLQMLKDEMPKIPSQYSRRMTPEMRQQFLMNPLRVTLGDPKDFTNLPWLFMDYEHVEIDLNFLGILYDPQSFGAILSVGAGSAFKIVAAHLDGLRHVVRNFPLNDAKEFIKRDAHVTEDFDNLVQAWKKLRIAGGDAAMMGADVEQGRYRQVLKVLGNGTVPVADISKALEDAKKAAHYAQGVTEGKFYRSMDGLMKIIIGMPQEKLWQEADKISEHYDLNAVFVPMPDGFWNKFAVGILQSAVSTRTGHAMAAKEAFPGGIDLNTSSGMQWKVSKDGSGVEMDIDPALIERLKRDGVNWLSPVILKITPVASIGSLAGV